MGNSQQQSGAKPHLVIIGGSFAGLEVFFKVKDFFRITIIDRTNYFEYLTLYYKEFAAKDTYDSLVLPYGSFLKKYENCTFIQGTLSKVSKDKDIEYIEPNGRT